MAADTYTQNRRTYQNISGAVVLGVGAVTQTLVTNVRTLVDTIYVQKLHVEITTGAAQTWTLQDSAGTPVPVVPSLSVAAIAHFDFDFGPFGVPLTLGTNLVLSISAAGAAGSVTWEGYQKRTAVAAA